MTRKRGFTIVELTVVVVIVSILAAILFPVFGQARAAARTTACQSDLYQIGLALQMYARDHDGRLPPRNDDWAPLATPYVPEISLFICPDDPVAPALQQANAAQTKGRDPLFSSYQYRGGLTLEDRPDLPLAGDWSCWHSDTGTVLYLSGSVKRVNKANWLPIRTGARPLPPGVTPPPENAGPNPANGSFE